MAAINLPSWFEANKNDLEPPVCNKMIHKEGHIKLFAVGGPNQRHDFHIEEGEELFYQVRGAMLLRVIEGGRKRDIPIEEGQVFLLPGNIFHSPQRYANTTGIVIERERLFEEKDGLVYFVRDAEDQPTSGKLFEKYFHCKDLGSQLAPIIRAYFASEQHRTGKPIPEELEPQPPVLPNPKARCGRPHNLRELLAERLKEAGEEGVELLPEDGVQSSFKGLGPGRSRIADPNGEVWVWVVKGVAVAEGEDGRMVHLGENDTLLVEQGKSFEIVREEGTMMVTYSQSKPKM